MMLPTWMAIAAAGTVGVLARYLLDLCFVKVTGSFPWTTLLINIAGSFAAGALAGGRTLSPELRTILLVGFCGGFTTFSAFSLQSLQLLDRGATWPAMLYLTLSPVLGLAAAASGFYLLKN